MTMIAPARRPLLAAGLAATLCAALAGCASLAPATRHTLPEAPDGPVVAGVSGAAVAVSRIGLPAYADVDGVALVQPSGALVVSSDDLWADPLARSATRRLAAALAQRTGGAALAEPWPLEFEPTHRVDVLVDQFSSERGGETVLTGEFRIADGRTASLTLARRFDIVTPVGGETYADVAASHAAALGQLADRIAAALR